MVKYRCERVISRGQDPEQTRRNYSHREKLRLFSQGQPLRRHSQRERHNRDRLVKYCDKYITNIQSLQSSMYCTPLGWRDTCRWFIRALSPLHLLCLTVLNIHTEQTSYNYCETPASMHPRITEPLHSKVQKNQKSTTHLVLRILNEGFSTCTDSATTIPSF